MDWVGLDYRVGQSKRALSSDLRERWSLPVDDMPEKLTLGQRVEALVLRMTTTVPSPALRVLTVTTAVPAAAVVLFHHQMSVAILAERAILQAGLVLCWRSMIGDCCANAAGQEKGATD